MSNSGALGVFTTELCRVLLRCRAQREALCTQTIFRYLVCMCIHIIVLEVSRGRGQVKVYNLACVPWFLLECTLRRDHEIR